MRITSSLAILAFASACQPAELNNLPLNTWVEIKYTTEQPADSKDQGRFARQGWNKIIYDPIGKRILFYDRWIDKKHGGYTIYGNCLFAFDPAKAVLTPLKIDNWTKIDTKEGGYRTLALPENNDEPTPCPRHVYHGFEYVPELDAVFICNGANQTALDKDGKLIGHDACDGAWRLDLKTNKWARIVSDQCPPNRLDDAMAYCPETKSIIYAGNGRQLWILDLSTGQWRKAKHSPPARTGMGQTIFYDPPRKRMLIAGGGPLDGWKKGKAAEFRELYAFDPKSETVQRLADCPTAFYATHLAYDSKRDAFTAVVVYDKGEQPSGMFAYDPKKDTWREIRHANAIPPHGNWFGWMQVCYDSRHDCVIGKVNDKFYAFRYAPEPADDRKGMADLPSKHGPHIKKIQALGDNSWLELGAPEPDPNWGKARGRSWCAAMPYSPELGGAFLFGEGVHGYAKPDGHYMDDLWFYDVNGHRWICSYPGADCKHLDLVIDKDGFEATRQGERIPVASQAHGYSMNTYDTDGKRLLSMPNLHTYWKKELPQRERWLKPPPADASPWSFEPATGRWDRRRTGTEAPPSSYGDTLLYIPSKKQACFAHRSKEVWFYDVKNNKWERQEPDGPPPPFGIDATSCYDPKRERIYIGGGAYPVAPDESHAFWIYDLKADRWVDPKPKGKPCRGSNHYSTLNALMVYDAANDKVLLVAHSYHYTKPERLGVYVYDPVTNAWDPEPLTLPEKLRNEQVKNGFYDPQLNAVFLHIAGDSRDDGIIWVYRYKRAK
jgi:hypothetical protein